MDIQKEEEIRLHKKLVKQYKIRYGEDYLRIYHHYWNNELLKGIPENKNYSALDCGCGTGILLLDLTRNFKNVFGLDLSLDLLRKIDFTSDAIKGVVVGDIENIPFSEKSFDTIICRGVLHHTPLPQESIKEIFNKLKKGGFFVLSEPCNDSLILQLPRRIFKKRSGRFTSAHKAFYSRDVKQMLIDAGFRINKSRNFGLLAFPLFGLYDMLPIARFLPFPNLLVRILIFLDEVFSRLPLIRNQCWHIIIQAEKN